MLDEHEKLIIKNDFPSLVGFAEKSVSSGETANIVTAGVYFPNSDLNDPFVQSCKTHISHMMSEIIFPKLLHHFSHNLPKNFYLHAVRIELFADEKQNTIYFNKEAKIKAKCKYVGGKQVAKNDLVKESDIEKILNLQCDERDPNAACLMLTFFRGNWIGIFDYHYNRKYASDKYQLAQTHLKAALNNYKKSDLIPFYSSLWDGYELLGESILLLHNQLKLKESHQKISKLLHGFCKIRDLDYDIDFQDIREIRDFVRYGPPHTTNIDYEEKALTYLQKTANFSKYVESFLKERAVNVNSIPIHNIDWFV
jgi:hypothetical protein